jgi:pimeloyl-ACP methyl ester carboxylesterase
MKSLALFGSALALATLGGAAPAGPSANVTTSSRPTPPAFQPKRFSVVVKGSGPDVILIPGLTASRDVWSSTVAAVPGYRYHLVQVAGFAGEPARGNASGQVVAPVAAEIGQYIRAKGLNRPAIVGHSMGGTVALMVASKHPTSVGKAMVVDMLPQPAGFVGSTTAGVRGLAETLKGLTATPGGRRLVEGVMEMFGGTQPPNRRSDPDVVARATHELALIDLTDDLARVRAPLTVVYAAPDPETVASVTQRYTAGYRAKRDAKLVRVDGSGHMVMHDQPARFRAALKAFLAG